MSQSSDEIVENNEMNISSPTSSEQNQVIPDAIETNSNSNQVSNNEKRPSDENDEPHTSKRPRLSSSQTVNPTTATNIISWIPPSKQLVTHLQLQSSSFFEFILSLVHIILTPSESHLTDEHCGWLHKTVNHYDHGYNMEKLNLLIETACLVVKTDLVR